MALHSRVAARSAVHAGRGSWPALTLLLAGALLLTAGCPREQGTRAKGPLVLHGDGGVVPEAVLTRGLVVYQQHCSACHGVDGRGPPPGGQYLRPAPRAFTQGLFKFGDVAAGELPRDEALARTVRNGLYGTPMPGWALSETDLHAVVQALKTFSPRWTEESPGAPIEVSPDPWKGREEEARARGEIIYHVSGAGNAGCASCHPAYVPQERLAQLTHEATGRWPRGFSKSLYAPLPRASDYARSLDDAGQAIETLPIVPPDFLVDRMKTVWPVGAAVDGRRQTVESQREALYRVIAGGVGGASMPAWKGALPEESLWALTHYVQGLVAQRGTPEAEARQEALSAQAPWSPPPADGPEAAAPDMPGVPARPRARHGSPERHSRPPASRPPGDAQEDTSACTCRRGGAEHPRTRDGSAVAEGPERFRDEARLPSPRERAASSRTPSSSEPAACTR